MVTGQGSSADSHAGVSTLYTLDVSSGKMVKRGTVDRVCSGTTYYRIGWPGQGPGKIARVLSWNRMLGMDEIQSIVPALLTCKTKSKRACISRGMCTVFSWSMHVATLVDGWVLLQLTHV